MKFNIYDEWNYANNNDGGDEAFVCWMDERSNLNKSIPILAIADLGLWNGRKEGYKKLDNLNECLEHDCKGESYVTIDVSDDDELTKEESHHDGTNHVTYRGIREDLEDELDEYLEEHGLPTGEMLDKFTYKLGPIVQEIYGY